MAVIVQSAAFDLGQISADFAARQTTSGAIVTFTGIVRADGGITGMDIEHYPGMTEKALSKIDAEASARWSLDDSLVLHRHGPMVPGEMIMMVATAARHRKHAFEAAEFLMDYLKSRAPFWKKEIGPDGTDWVKAKDEDETALKRW